MESPFQGPRFRREGEHRVEVADGQDAPRLRAEIHFSWARAHRSVPVTAGTVRLIQDQ